MAQGESLKHLSENIGMGGCYRTYEEGHDGCMRCGVRRNCKEATRAAKEANDGVYADESMTVLDRFFRVMARSFDLHEVKNGGDADLYVFAMSSITCKIARSHKGELKIAVHGDILEEIPELKIDEVEPLVEKLVAMAQDALASLDENE